MSLGKPARHSAIDSAINTASNQVRADAASAALTCEEHIITSLNYSSLPTPGAPAHVDDTIQTSDQASDARRRTVRQESEPCVRPVKCHLLETRGQSVIATAEKSGMARAEWKT